jgi:hypothetical protein
VDHELVPVGAVESHPVLILHSCKRQDVRDTIGVVPYLPVSGQVAGEVRARHPGIAVGIHEGVGLPDVLQQLVVVKKRRRWTGCPGGSSPSEPQRMAD